MTRSELFERIKTDSLFEGIRKSVNDDSLLLDFLSYCNIQSVKNKNALFGYFIACYFSNIKTNSINGGLAMAANETLEMLINKRDGTRSDSPLIDAGYTIEHPTVIKAY